MSGSYRQILRSTSIIGGASIANILVGLLRMKAAALLLGPSGVGLIGLFTNVVSAAAIVAGLGFGNVGTRQIAEASAANEPQRVVVARLALFWGTLGLAIVGVGVFWALRGLLAREVLGDATLGSEIGWLAVAVGLTIAAASQSALLNGLRRIGDIARVSVWSAMLSTVIAIAALMLWGRAGVVAYVIAGPLAAFGIGHWYVARLPRIVGKKPGIAALGSEWRKLAGLGFAFMVAGLAGVAGQLAVRILVQRQLGLDALGHFHAAWAISMTYIGFVLGAMGTDYYPRLTGVIRDHAAVNRMVNQQTEVALLLATPVLLAMLGLAPWVIGLLYSEAFDGAVAVLRWQVMGDVLKVASWPLGMIMLASGAGRTFMFTEWAVMGFFVGLTALLLPSLGLQSTGLAFFGMYVVLLVIVLAFARRRTGFAWSASVLRLLVCSTASAALVMASALGSPVAGAVASIVAAAGFGVAALVRLAHASALGGPAGRLIGLVRNQLVKIGAWRGD